MAEGDTRRIFERLDQMGQEITRLVVLGEAKNEAGEYELVTLTVGDFESILLKSALLQQSAYKRFKQARDAVNKYKRADKIFSVEF